MKNNKKIMGFSALVMGMTIGAFSPLLTNSPLINNSDSLTEQNYSSVSSRKWTPDSDDWHTYDRHYNMQLISSSGGNWHEGDASFVKRFDKPVSRLVIKDTSSFEKKFYHGDHVTGWFEDEWAITFGASTSSSYGIEEENTNGISQSTKQDSHIEMIDGNYSGYSLGCGDVFKIKYNTENGGEHEHLTITMSLSSDGREFKIEFDESGTLSDSDVAWDDDFFYYTPNVYADVSYQNTEEVKYFDYNEHQINIEKTNENIRRSNGNSNRNIPIITSENTYSDIEKYLFDLDLIEFTNITSDNAKPENYKYSDIVFYDDYGNVIENEDTEHISSNKINLRIEADDQKSHNVNDGTSLTPYYVDNITKSIDTLTIPYLNINPLTISETNIFDYGNNNSNISSFEWIFNEEKDKWQLVSNVNVEFNFTSVDYDYVYFLPLEDGIDSWHYNDGSRYFHTYDLVNENDSYSTNKVSEEVEIKTNYADYKFDLLINPISEEDIKINPLDDGRFLNDETGVDSKYENRNMLFDENYDNNDTTGEIYRTNIVSNAGFRIDNYNSNTRVYKFDPEHLSWNIINSYDNSKGIRELGIYKVEKKDEYGNVANELVYVSEANIHSETNWTPSSMNHFKNWDITEGAESLYWEVYVASGLTGADKEVFDNLNPQKYQYIYRNPNLDAGGTIGSVYDLSELEINYDELKAVTAGLPENFFIFENFKDIYSEIIYSQIWDQMHLTFEDVQIEWLISDDEFLNKDTPIIFVIKPIEGTTKAINSYQGEFNPF